MAQLEPMPKQLSLAIIISFIVILISFFLPFISVEGYTEENYNEQYYVFGFQSIPPYLALVIGLFVAGFGMGISSNKTANIVVTSIAAIVYFLVFLFMSAISTMSWGNGYSYKLSFGFLASLLGVISLSILSIANSARKPRSQENRELLD